MTLDSGTIFTPLTLILTLTWKKCASNYVLVHDIWLLLRFKDHSGKRRPVSSVSWRKVSWFFLKIHRTINWITGLYKRNGPLRVIKLSNLHRKILYSIRFRCPGIYFQNLFQINTTFSCFPTWTLNTENS
jgi:hypothetical protein